MLIAESQANRCCQFPPEKKLEDSQGNDYDSYESEKKLAEAPEKEFCQLPPEKKLKVSSECSPPSASETMDAKRVAYSDSDDEEYDKAYYEQVSASDGFDVEVFPSRGTRYMPIGNIVPIRNGNEVFDPILKECSDLAINSYNQHNSANYEVVKVLKANMQAARGIQYYITFEARDANGIMDRHDQPPQIFQASVVTAHDGDEVVLCRIKPSSN